MQERSGTSNIGRKRKTNHCSHLYDCHWNISSTSNYVPEKKFKRRASGWRAGGSLSACYPNVWTHIDVFTKWFDHFVHFVKPSADDPILLIVDGHYSHTRNLDMVDKARENRVSIVSLPPHSTHKMQLLDVGFVAPCKTYYVQEIEMWLGSSPDRVVTLFVVCILFGAAYRRAAPVEAAVNSFI